MKRLFGRPSPGRTEVPSGKLFTAHSRPQPAPPPDDEGPEAADADEDPDGADGPALSRGGLFSDAPAPDEGDDDGSAFDDELFSPENLAALEQRARAEQAITERERRESAVTEAVTPEREAAAPPGSWAAPTAPPTPADAADVPPHPPAPAVVVSDIPPAEHPVEDAEERSHVAALTDELTRLAEDDGLGSLDADDESLEELGDALADPQPLWWEVSSAPAAQQAEDRHDDGLDAGHDASPDDEPSPWVGHTDDLDEPYAAPAAAAPRSHDDEPGEPYPTHEAHDGSSVEVTATDGEHLVVRREQAATSAEDDAEADDGPTAGTDDADTVAEEPLFAPRGDEPAADATETGTDAAEAVDAELAETAEVEAAEVEAPDAVEADEADETDDAEVEANTDAETAETEPDGAVEPESAAEPAPRTSMPDEQEPTAAHAAAHDLPDDSPQTRVHAERLDSRPGPIKLTPSEAVTLAAEGPGALRRRRRPS